MPEESVACSPPGYGSHQSSPYGITAVGRLDVGHVTETLGHVTVRWCTRVVVKNAMHILRESLHVYIPARLHCVVNLRQAHYRLIVTRFI